MGSEMCIRDRVNADFTGTVTVTSTDAGALHGPILDLYRNSASPADGDALGVIRFTGIDEQSNKSTYAQIAAWIEELGEDDFGGLNFYIGGVDGTDELFRTFYLDDYNTYMTHALKIGDGSSFAAASNGLRDYNGFWVTMSHSITANRSCNFPDDSGTIMLNGKSYQDADGDTKIQVEESSDEDIIRFDTAGTERMTIGATGTVTITGDLTVNGTTTEISSTTITVDDKNIELGAVASPDDTTADGGGITLKGASDKTWNWVNSTDAWTSSEHIALATGKSVYIDGVIQLSKNSLAATVVLADGVTATTQAADDNTTKLATTAYVQTELAALSSDSISDADSDTKIQVEESSDEDKIRFDVGGTETAVIDSAGLDVTGNVVYNTALSAQTAAYTFVLADRGKLVTVSNGSAVDCTVPPNSSVAFAVGTSIMVAQTGAGQVTMVAGSGVTLRSSPGLKLRAQYSSVTCTKIATDEWLLTGDLDD